MKITILTLFKDMFESVINSSIIKRAIDKKLVEIEIKDIREYSLDKHKQVDDTPFGGGSGMVIKLQPVLDCLNDIKTEDSYVLLTAPIGKVLNQKKVKKYSKFKHLIIICGHYEGIDYRINKYVDEIVSIGDYILTGGEMAAMVISDAVIRLQKGVIKEESTLDESFENDLLEYPHYTKPYDYNGDKVPDVLISGHHENIRKFRLEQSILLTKNNRPDLLENRDFTKEELQILEKLSDN